MKRFRFRLAFVVLLATLALGGCKTSTLPNDPTQMPEMIAPEKAKSPSSSSAGWVARLRAMGGSSATGTVSVVDQGDGMSLQLVLNNLPSGMYAWVLHENGNCTSTNGFSAGRGWVPKGVRKEAVDVLPEFLINSEQATTVTARVRDAKIAGDGGIIGRSILIYQGGGIAPIKPGVPNNVVACGVFEPAQPLSF